MRFLCDEMLLRLGRWLRAAGYDTEIAGNGAEDRMLIDRALAEKRVLLTRDKELARAARDRTPALLLAGESLDQAADHLRQGVAVDWLHAPFTRCLVDNRQLLAAAPKDLDRVPESSRPAAAEALRRCPACGRLYWPGGHFRRMHDRLARWRDASTPL